MGRKDLRKCPPAIILGRPNANLLGQVRALGRQGVRVYCVLTRGEPPVIARLSRYVDRLRVVQHAQDEEIVAAIQELSALAEQPPVLFFGGDYDITLAARLWPQIHSHVVAVTPPVEASRFNDKAQQVEQVLSAGSGVSVPQTRVITSAEDIEKANREMTFPVICRPVELARKGLFEGKMFVATDGNELQSRLSPIFSEGAAGEVLVQEYVPGGNDQLYVALASCDSHGNAEAIVTARKLYEYPEGLMCIGETVQNQDLLEASSAVFRAFGVSGVLGVEFKYDQQRDRFWFIEVNFRPDNFHSIVEGAGVNLMLHAYLSAIGRQDLYCSSFTPKDTVWRDISLVVLSRFSGKKPPAVSTKGRRKVDAYWALSDPLPALAWYFVKVWRVLKGRLSGRTFE